MGETDGLNRQTTYTHDKAGRTKTVADPRPVTVTYTYDKADRLVSTTATGLTTISMAYDVAGRRTSMQDETGTTTYTYNGLDNLTAAAHSVDGTVTYGYDLLGRRTSLTASQTGAPYIAYLYDAAGRLADVKQATGPGQTQTLVAHADYDAAGRLQAIERANGADTTYSYDNADRLSSLTTTQGISNTTLTDFDYTLNRRGQVTTAVETIGQATRTITYTYDGLQRLTVATEQPGTTYGYTYDLVGNRTQVTKNAVVTESRTYDAADQVSNTGWQYDDAGSLLADGTNTYTYDALNRLSGVTTSGTTSQYAYNGDGVLAAESVGSNQTRYVLDTTGGLPERLGAISTNNSNTNSTWYVRGWNQELNRQEGSATLWYIADHLGSVRATLDDTGTLVSSYNYDPFGTPDGTSIPQDYGFTGEPQSSNMGLVHLRARWYSTGAGRFFTHDPLSGSQEQPMTLHRYMYGYNDPVHWTDPTGEQSRDRTCPVCPTIPIPTWPWQTNWGELGRELHENQKSNWQTIERGWQVWSEWLSALNSAATTTSTTANAPCAQPAPVPKTLSEAESSKWTDPKPKPEQKPVPIPLPPPTKSDSPLLVNIDANTVHVFVSADTSAFAAGVKTKLEAYVSGKQMVVTQTAIAEAARPISGSGPIEKANFLSFLKRVHIIPDMPSQRVKNLKRSLSRSGPIHDADVNVFGTGDQLGIVTMSADKAFPRAAAAQGVDLAVYTHQPVPLVWR